ncbi:hypothetical protein JCM6882_001375 [Rhodosporidiobolus microsporus]
MPAAGPPPLPILSFGTAHPLDEAALPSFPTSVLPTDQASDAPGPSSQLSTSSSLSVKSGSSLDMQHVARAVLKAKRVAVVCGAGISTATGIPDFRSGAGLFKSLKEQYPDAKLTSGKDLFDVGLFSSESNAAIFYNMIAALKKQADDVEPTAFHSWLKELDDEGKLFRVYTQNIDALEEKAGLTYGLGDKSLPLPPRRASRSPTKPRASTSSSTTPKTGTPSSTPLMPTSSQISSDSSSSYPTPRPSLSPPPPPPTHSTIPRVIPLHGHLLTLSCSHCKFTTPTSEHLTALQDGSAPICPSCQTIESARIAAGNRSRGVGMLRPDVVLYGEEHKDGERVGEITRRDLMGQRPDLLIVVGTTLKVKGTKRLVTELAKVIRPPPKETDAGESEPSSSASTRSRASAAASTAASAGKKRAREKPPPIHTVYLNYDFPTPSRDWAGLFDIWLRGDIQQFVAAVRDEKVKVKAEEGERERKRQKKRESSAAGSSGLGGGVKNAAFGAGVHAKSAGTMGVPPSPSNQNRFHVEIQPRRAPLDRSVPPHLRSPERQPAPSFAPAPPPIPVPASAFLAPIPSTSAGVGTGAVPPGPLMPFSMGSSPSFSTANLPPLPAAPLPSLPHKLPALPPPTPPQPSKKRSRSPSPAFETATRRGRRAGKGVDAGYTTDSSLTSVDSDSEGEVSDGDDEEEADDSDVISIATAVPSPTADLPVVPRKRSNTESSGSTIIAATPPPPAKTKRTRRASRADSIVSAASTSASTAGTFTRRSSPRDSVVSQTVDSLARSHSGGRRGSLTTILNQDPPAAAANGRGGSGKKAATQKLAFPVTKKSMADVTGTGRKAKANANGGAGKGKAGGGKRSRSGSEEGSEASGGGGSISSYGRRRSLRMESMSV